MDKIPKYTFGFNKETEILNGRLAMIAFIVIFLIELCFNRPLLTLINLID